MSQKGSILLSRCCSVYRYRSALACMRLEVCNLHAPLGSWHPAQNVVVWPPQEERRVGGCGICVRLDPERTVLAPSSPSTTSSHYHTSSHTMATAVVENGVAWFRVPPFTAATTGGAAEVFVEREGALGPAAFGLPAFLFHPEAHAATWIGRAGALRSLPSSSLVRHSLRPGCLRGVGRPVRLRPLPSRGQLQAPVRTLRACSNHPAPWTGIACAEAPRCTTAMA